MTWIDWQRASEKSQTLSSFSACEPGRAVLSTTCPCRTNLEWPCCISQFSVADALLTASSAGELTNTIECAKANTRAD